MEIWTYLSQFTGRPVSQLLGEVSVHQDGVGVFSFPVWGAGGTPPTSAQVVAALAAPPAKSELVAYANAKLSGLLAAGRSYTLATGVSVLCDATPATGTDLISLLTWGAANQAATQPWVDNAGTVTTITGAQAVVLADSVLAYGQSGYAVLATACTEIASGGITATAQVDALGWPV